MVEEAAVLRIAGLAAVPGLVHGFSTAALGSMRGPGPGRSPITPERRALAEALGLDAGRLTAARAVHGATVARVDAPGTVAGTCDALVTDRPGQPLLATFADCWPALLFDQDRRALALVHAGWRGTAAGVVAGAVAALRREYGCRPQDLVVGLGPGICRRCYEVGEDVAARFDGVCLQPSTTGRFLLDLAAANRAQLEGAGVPADQIHEHGACTRESPELASHRRCPDGRRFACMAAIV
ncbi:MAG TPA: polyphenol oxidase family protein [Candidatus Dormibacteraeota bacterium]|nr:polyphenol oxidase family protein [Candidatus Dormibacteraeota bacterium]